MRRYNQTNKRKEQDNKMNIETLLDQIEDILDSGSKVPLSSKIGVDAAAIRTAIEDIRLNLPNEITQARAIVADRNNILIKAKDEAVNCVTSAQEKSRALISSAEDKVRALVLKTEEYSKNKVAEADAQAKQIVSTANEDAKIIRANAQLEAAAMVDAHEVVVQAKAAAESIAKAAQDEAASTIAGAKAQADNIVNAATEQAERERAEARATSDEAIDKANKWSAEIRIAAGDFIEDIMKTANDAVAASLMQIQSARDNIRTVTGKIEKPNALPAETEE